jgi:hypothetical protein
MYLGRSANSLQRQTNRSAVYSRRPEHKGEPWSRLLGVIFETPYALPKVKYNEEISALTFLVACLDALTFTQNVFSASDPTAEIGPDHLDAPSEMSQR